MLLKNKESGYSLLEVSVALGIAAAISIPATGYAVSDFSNVETETLASSGNVFSDLEDVSLIDPNIGEVIVFNGVEWVNQKMNLNFLGDVQLAIIPSEGDVVVFDGNNWVNQSTPAPQLVNLSNVDISEPEAGQSLVWNGSKWVNSVGGMTGEMQMWANSDAPDGWLIADGRAVSRSTYSELFLTIGLTYGAGDGSTTFNLPDFSGRVGIGSDTSQTEFDALGKTGGQKTVTLTEAQMPTHTHTQQAHGHTGTASDGGAHGHTGTADAAGVHTHAGTTNSTGNHSHSMSTRNGSGNTKCCKKNALRSSYENRTGSGSPSHSHTATVGSSDSHTHTLSVEESDAHGHDVALSNTTAVNDDAGGGESHENMQPYIVTTYIIKY